MNVASEWCKPNQTAKSFLIIAHDEFLVNTPDVEIPFHLFLIDPRNFHILQSIPVEIPCPPHPWHLFGLIFTGIAHCSSGTYVSLGSHLKQAVTVLLFPLGQVTNNKSWWYKFKKPKQKKFKTNSQRKQKQKMKN